MIRNINPKWGDSIEFRTPDEMATVIAACGYPLPEAGLAEGTDYEVIEHTGAIDAMYAKLQGASLAIAVMERDAQANMERARALAVMMGAHAMAGDAEWFQAEASKTSAGPDGVAGRLAAVAPLMHAAVGLATEAGEMLDALKKHVWYGSPLDRANCKEELGDVAWYLAEACTALEVPMRDVFIRNISKLRRRYSNGAFSAKRAAVRDLRAERAVFESTMPIAHLCRTTQNQQCHICEDFQCGDNMNPKKEADHAR